MLVLVHEFGHFIVAKKSGIRVDEFGLGFPPKVFAKKWGDTLYTLNAIPFGGFVKIFGEDPHAENIEESDKTGSFHYKPKWVQALVLVAGVTMNILFAWLVLSLGFTIGFPAPVDYSPFGKTTNINLIVTEILPGSPADKAGLMAGDRILSASTGDVFVEGESLSPESVSTLIAESGTRNVGIAFVRGDASPQEINVTPDSETVPGKRAIGVGMDSMGVLKLPVHLALLEGVRTTWYITEGTAVGLVKFLWDTARFQSDFSQVAGPVGIAGVVGEARALGFTYLLSLIALISINLAIINLLPFPALDGGRLLFVGIEAVIRRPINPVFVRWANMVGFMILILLMLVVTLHDITNLF